MMIPALTVVVLTCVSGVSDGFQPRAKPTLRTPIQMAAHVPANDLMIRAARREHVSRTPIWLFRQAGRHLPEYREYKEKTGKNFLELLKDPKDVAEVTMQPVRRYDLDAAILFSDILVIAEAYGFKVEMPGGKGITVPEPLTSPEEVYSRLPEKVDIHKELPHVIAAVTAIRESLIAEGRDIPLIGFSAAPFTLLFYMVGASSKKNQQVPESWLVNHPTESKELLQRLTNTVIDYLCAQAEAGAHMLQVFEAMGEHISPESFYAYALPCMEEIAREVKRRHPDVPLLVFPRGACYALKELQQAGYDVVTLDCNTPLSSTRSLLKDAADGDSMPSAIQGNLDPAVLRRKEDGIDKVDCEGAVKDAARRLLAEAGPQAYIANLGEGFRGDEDPELVNLLVEEVHAASEEMIQSQA
mmetsp:Transcript_8042/g.10079  ORF Transcript_8042/g.10079 Transcript_8042/m.10079 type:complete len:413 (-) Transcript_8042:574-1812(-)